MHLRKFGDNVPYCPYYTSGRANQDPSLWVGQRLAIHGTTPIRASQLTPVNAKYSFAGWDIPLPKFRPNSTQSQTGPSHQCTVHLSIPNEANDSQCTCLVLHYGYSGVFYSSNITVGTSES